MTTNTMTLPVRLTDVELLAKAKELAAKLAEAGDVESRKKLAVNECKEKADRLAKEVSVLAGTLRTGKEAREVEVQEVRDDISRTIETVRIDTGEVVSSRAMTIHELQRPLFEDRKDEATTVLRAV